MGKPVKVWDVPTRLFHWTLLAMFAGMWVSAEIGQLQLHTRLGVAMLVLVVFRLLWGLVGSQSARFASFVRGPATIRRYLRGELAEAEQPGHNPLGGLMVLALLLALLVQLGLGLFAADVDSYTFDGPLAKLAGSAAEQVTQWHELWFNVLIGLVAVHVLAIVAYRLFRRTNLVLPMLTGVKHIEGQVAPLRFVSGWRAWLMLAVAAAMVLGGLSLV